jgi:hypothetical protein
MIVFAEVNIIKVGYYKIIIEKHDKVLKIR